MPKDGLSGRNLDHVSLTGENLAGTNLSKSSLRRARLQGANLTGADLRGSDLHDANLDGAEVTDADLSDADLRHASLQGVDLDQAASLEGARFGEADDVPATPSPANQAQPANPRREGDIRGQGVTDGAALADDVVALHAALTEPAWITRAPETHLLPHLERACAEAGSRWTLLSHQVEAGMLVVDLTWHQPEGSLRQLRTDVFALIGTVAESVAFVRQLTTPDGLEFRVATGMLDGDNPPAEHGHVLILRVTMPDDLDGGHRNDPGLGLDHQ